MSQISFLHRIHKKNNDHGIFLKTTLITISTGNFKYNFIQWWTPITKMIRENSILFGASSL